MLKTEMQISDYPLETHYVETEDGYILTLFRFMVNPAVTTSTFANNNINHGVEENENEKKLSDNISRPPVLLVHGMMCAGTEWLANSPEKVLPFLLAQEGYDCWIGCFRGTRLTGPTAHIKYTMEDSDYWDFSVDEFGSYDIPAMIDYILLKTKQPNLFYVGHSLGSTSVLLALAKKPEYNQKVRAIAALTPAIYGSHCQNWWLSKLSAPVYSFLGKSRFIYRRRICSTSCAELVKKYWPCMPILGIKQRLFRLYAQYILKVVSREQVEQSRLSQLCDLLPGQSSMKLVCHVMQCLWHKKAQGYDYGNSGNIKKYGQPRPPTYNINNITAPVALYSSDHDFLVGPEEVLQLSKDLKNVIKYKKVVGKFYHMDFMVGKDAHKLVYNDVIEVFNKFKNDNKRFSTKL